MTANEARALAQAAQDAQLNDNRVDILNRIQEAANAGHTNLLLANMLVAADITYFQDLGYVVDNYPNYSEISWE